jgi:hypothetical protein
MAPSSHTGCMILVLILVGMGIVLAPFGTENRPEWIERPRPGITA